MRTLNEKGYSLSGPTSEISEYKSTIDASLKHDDSSNIFLSDIFNQISYASTKLGSEYATEYKKLVFSILNLHKLKVNLKLEFDKFIDIQDEEIQDNEIQNTTVLKKMRTIVNDLHDSILNIENQIKEINKTATNIDNLDNETNTESDEHRLHIEATQTLLNFVEFKLKANDLQSLKDNCDRITYSYELSTFNHLRLSIKEFFTIVKYSFNAAINFIRTAANWVVSIPNNLYNSVKSIFATTPKLSESEKPVTSANIETVASTKDINRTEEGRLGASSAEEADLDLRPATDIEPEQQSDACENKTENGLVENEPENGPVENESSKSSTSPTCS